MFDGMFPDDEVYETGGGSNPTNYTSTYRCMPFIPLK